MSGKKPEMSGLKETRLPEDTPKSNKYLHNSQETALPKNNYPSGFSNYQRSSVKQEQPQRSSQTAYNHLSGSKTLKLKNINSKLELLYERMQIGQVNTRSYFNKNFEDMQWQIEKSVPMSDSRGKSMQKEAEIKIPQVILDDVDQFKKKDAHFNYFKNFFQIGNCAYFILSNRIYLWFYQENQFPVKYDFLNTVKNLCLIDCPYFLTENGRYKFLLIVAMENTIEFKLIDSEHQIKNINHILNIDKVPEYFHYDRISKRIFVGFANREYLDELKIREIKQSLFHGFKCKKDEIDTFFVHSFRESSFKKLKTDLQTAIIGKKYDFISHKMVVDISKGYLYHLESQWAKSEDKATHQPTEILVNQCLSCYDIENGKFVLKGRKEMKDLKKSIMFYHGQDNNQIKNLQKSAISGISIGMGTEWDLNLAFESGQQIHVRIIGSQKSFEILFHSVIYSSNYTQNREVKNIGSRVLNSRIESAGSLAFGQLNYLFFEMEEQNMLILENESSINSSIVNENIGENGKLYPTDKADTPTLSLLFTESEYKNERLSISEVFEPSPFQEVLDFACLGRYKKDRNCLNQLHQNMNFRHKIAVLHGEKLRVFVKLNYSDIVYQMLLALSIACGSENEEIISILTKDISFYALKMGIDSFCSTLLTILMSEQSSEFILSDTLIKKYEDYLKKMKFNPYFSDILMKDPLTNVKSQAAELLYIFGQFNEFGYRQKLFNEMKSDHQFSRIFDYGKTHSLLSDFTAKSFSGLLALANILNANWGRLFFNYDNNKLFKKKGRLEDRVTIKEIQMTVKLLERLKKAILFWKQIENELDSGKPNLDRYIFEQEFKKRIQAEELNLNFDSNKKSSVSEGGLFGSSFVKVFNKSNGKTAETGTSGSQKLPNTGMNSFNQSKTDIYETQVQIKDDTNYLELIDFTVERAIEVLNILLNINRSDIMKDTLPKDVKDSLSELKFEELLFETKYEDLIKRILLKMTEISTTTKNDNLQSMHRQYSTLSSHGELLVFKNLKEIKKTGASSRGGSAIDSNFSTPIQLEENLNTLKRNIGSLRLTYLVDNFKSFIKCGCVKEFIELVILRIEYLDREKPAIEKELDTFNKLVAQDMQEETKNLKENPEFSKFDIMSKNFGSNLLAKNKIAELSEKLGINLQEQSGLMRNLFTIIIELSGLEKKQKEYFSLPKIFKKYRTLDKLWNKIMPKAKPSLIKMNWSKLNGKEKNLTFFQKSLVLKDRVETKQLLMTVLKRILSSSNEQLRMKMLVWLFGEGKLSLLDKIDSNGDNIKLTNDLCNIAQSKGIIDASHGTQSCIYLINSFEKRKKYDVVIDLISKLIDNSFIGQEGKGIVKQAEEVLKSCDFVYKAPQNKQIREVSKSLTNLKLPDLRTKLIYISRARKMINNNMIPDLKNDQRKNILELFELSENSCLMQEQIFKRLENLSQMLQKTVDFLKKCKNKGSLDTIHSLMFNSVWTSTQILAFYGQRIKELQLFQKQISLANLLISAKIFTRADIIKSFILKYDLFSVYLFDVCNKFQGQNELIQEFSRGIEKMLESCSKFDNIQSLILFGCPEAEQTLRINPESKTLVIDSDTFEFLLESATNSYLYPMNFQDQFTELFNNCSKKEQVTTLLSFAESMPNLVENIEDKNWKSGIVSLMLDELEQYVKLESLGSDESSFKNSSVAKNYLKLINEGGVNSFWISNLLRDQISKYPILICGLMQNMQEHFVELSIIRGDDRVELAFRYAMMIVRLIKDLTVYLKKNLEAKELTEEQKNAFKYFNGNYEDWRRLLSNLYRATIIDKYSLTEERQLFLQYMAHNSLTFIEDLANDSKYSNLIYTVCGSKQKLRHKRR